MTIEDELKDWKLIEVKPKFGSLEYYNYLYKNKKFSKKYNRVFEAGLKCKEKELILEFEKIIQNLENKKWHFTDWEELKEKLQLLKGVSKCH